MAETATSSECHETEFPKLPMCHRRLKLVCKLSLILNLVLLTIFLVIVFVFKSDQDYQTHGSTPLDKPELAFKSDEDLGRDSLCLPCDYLSDTVKSSDTMYDVIIKSDCGHKMCCLKDQTDVRNLITKMIYEDSNLFLQISQNNSKSSVDWWRKRRRAAHLYVDHSAPREDGMVWTTKDQQSTSFVNDLSFTNNNLSITEDDDNGIYFVYSAVTFELSQSGEIPRGYHQIVRRNKFLMKSNGEQLENVIQMNKFGGSPTQSRWYTSFLCGTVNLQKYDLVSARAGPNDTKLDKRKYSNYFGMFRL